MLPASVLTAPTSAPSGRDAMIDCPECDGTGESTYEVFHPMSFSNPYGDFEERPCACDNCNGSGEVEPLEGE